MTGPAHHGAYLHGPGVVVPDEVAAWLDRRVPLQQLRGRARGEDPVVDAVLAALRFAALRAESSASGSADGSDAGTNPTSTAPIEAASQRRVGTRAAARQLGLTDRAVRKAIGSGRLPAQQVAGRAWSIAQDDVNELARRRAG